MTSVVGTFVLLIYSGGSVDNGTVEEKNVVQDVYVSFRYFVLLAKTFIYLFLLITF